jgi:hypothetical protein
VRWKVSQRSVLICDLLHEKEKFAVVTRRLVIELDLCRVHDHGVLQGRPIVIPKGFAKLLKQERKVTKTSKKKYHPVKRRAGKRGIKQDYELIAQQILGYAHRLGKSFNGREARKVLKLSSDSVAHKAILMLLKTGKLKSSGVGPARKLEVTTKNGARAA